MLAEALRPAPLPSVRRLPQYLRFLELLKARGRDVVSCTHIADELGLQSVQVRKDLSVTGIVGRPRIGYSVGELIDSIKNFLGWNNTRDAFLVGAGSLGSALLGYQGADEYRLNIVAGFDVDPAKVGLEIHGKPVFALEKLADLAPRMHVLIGVLTVPAAAAEEAAAAMVRAGIRAIWNYTPVRLAVPDRVIVEDVKLAASMAVLSSRLAEALRRESSKRSRRRRSPSSPLLPANDLPAE